jgi:hypothetical protein
MTPRKRVLALGLLAGVVAISSALAGRHPGAAVALAAGGDTAPTATTIKLLEDEAPFTMVKTGHHTGLAVGDEAFSNRTLRTMQKKPVGQLNIDCVTTKGGLNYISICTGVYTLPGGTLVGTTLSRGPTQGPNTLHIAITGGTGRYEGARGSVLSLGSPTGLANDTIHLLP